MTHIHSSFSTSFQKAFTAAFLMVGVVTVSTANAQTYAMSGQGTTLELSDALSTSLHAAAVGTDISTVSQLMILGLLVMLAGFFMHAMHVVNNRGHRMVLAH